MGVNSPLTEHKGAQQHSGSLGDIVSSGLHSRYCARERSHCPPSGGTDGGLRGKRERKKKSVSVSLSILKEGRANGGRAGAV